MKNLRRISLLLMTVMMLGLPLAAQKQRFADLMEAMFSMGQLSPEGVPANVTWIEDGEKYSFIRNNQYIQEIWTRTVKSGKEEKVFTNEDLTFPGSSQAFRFESFAWTRDFQFILFQANFRPIWRYSGNSDYYVYSLREGSLKLAVADAFSAEISPDGKSLGYGKDGDLYLYLFETGQNIRLTNDAHGQVYNGRFGWAQEEEFGLVQGWSWSNDSRYIAYWQSDETDVPVYSLTDFSGQHPEYMEVPYPKVGDNPPKVRIGVIDTYQRKSEWLDIDMDGGYIPRIYWTARPNTLAVMWMNRIQDEVKLYMFDVASGSGSVVMEEKAKGWIDIFDFWAGNLHLMYFPEDVEQFFWISERDGWAHIYRFDYSGRLVNQVTTGDFEVKGIDAIDAKGKNIYYVSTEESPLEQNLYMTGFDGKGKKRLTTARGNHTVDVSPNGKYYIDSYSDVNTPEQSFLMGSNGKVLGQLGDNSAAVQFLGNHVYAPCELFSFTTPDGQKLDGYLIKPVDFVPGRKYPLMLDIYGGPGSQEVFNSFGNNGWHQWLAQNGYVIASVNNRGNGGYGSDFEKIVHRQLGKMESYDFAETAKYLSSLPFVDGDNMAIRGHSYGGYTSSYTMLTHPGVFKVSLTAAPVTDHLLYDCILTERYMGLKEDNAEGYRQSAVTTHARNLDGHLLLAHSLMDENVHPQNTFQLVRALTDAGKDFDLKIYPPGNHSIAYSLNTYLLLMGQYTEYLDRYLK